MAQTSAPPTNTAIKLVGFVVITVVLVALAGPFPTLINGVLLLVLSGIILARSGAVVSFISGLGGTSTPAAPSGG